MAKHLMFASNIQVYFFDIICEIMSNFGNIKQRTTQFVLEFGILSLKLIFSGDCASDSFDIFDSVNS